MCWHSILRARLILIPGEIVVPKQQASYFSTIKNDNPLLLERESHEVRYGRVLYNMD